MNKTFKEDNAKLQPQDATTRAICKYIDEHLQENLSYKHMQKIFFVSRYYLATKFLQQTGMTLTKYVILRRLCHTCALAKNGMTIEEAAYQSGFNNYSHFYKEFTKNFRLSPREYFGKL